MKKTLIKSLTALFLLTFCTQAWAQQYQPLAIKKHNEGVTFYNKRQYENAIECFLEAIMADPSFVDSYYNLAVLYEYKGETPKALAAYKKLLSVDNYNQEAAYKIAEIYSKQKNYKVAQNYLKLVPTNSPRYASAQELNKKLTNTIAHEKEQCNIFEGASGVTYKGIASPSGITKDSTGNIYVANFVQNSITVITPKGEKKTLYKGAPLSGPTGIAVDGFNNVYVSCINSGKVVMISQDHACKTILKGLNRPSGLFIDSDNHLYISVQGQNSIIKHRLF